MRNRFKFLWYFFLIHKCSSDFIISTKSLTLLYFKDIFHALILIRQEYEFELNLIELNGFTEISLILFNSFIV